MRYDFDKATDRRGTCSIKWSDDVMSEINGKRGLLPLWVADMDFGCPKPVIDAVIEEARCGVFGYSLRTDAYKKAFTSFYERRHGWHVEEDWMVFSPGVVTALNALVQEFTSAGDEVIVQPPVYHPFFYAIRNNGRVVSENRLLQDTDGRYSMDFDDLEKKAASPRAKMVFLCSPHNPVGRVWDEWELRRFAEICAKNGLIMVADEIHCDLVFKAHRHIPFATLSDDYAVKSVICTAPSKTFNLAGMQVSEIVIPNVNMREAFERRLESNGISEPNYFGVAAAQAAFTHGDDWLGQVLCYLEENADLIGDFVKSRLPKVKYRKPEGTYLAWLDFRSFGMATEELMHHIVEKAGLALNQGSIFGEPGEGFVRLNFACPRSLLVEALEKLEGSFGHL